MLEIKFRMNNIAVFVLLFLSCSKANNAADNNHLPAVTLSAVLTSAGSLTYTFTATASDADGDKLSYQWDFGDGVTKTGAASESHSFAESKSYTIKLSVSDGRGGVANAAIAIATSVSVVNIDLSREYQQMEGFGGFGAQDVYWSSGPFTSAGFVNDVINDLGLTILRDNVPLNFEEVNDDNDPNTTNLANFQYGSFTDHIQYLKDMKAAGLQKLIVSCWSPAAWMKTNNSINGDKADAPVYNPNPTKQNNQLRTDMYEEFAERCAAYIKIVKKETGLDIYAFSLQNEPRFTEPYESCVFDGNALRDLIKVVGARFVKEGITAKIFSPEDTGYFDGIASMVLPTLNDPEARKYISIIAVHGYATDGVTAQSADAQTWQKMYAWGKPYNLPLWMTETSGYSNDMDGAMKMAKAMYTAINFGSVSAWVHWELSQATLDAFSLMSSAGQKSKRYFVSKNVYRYVRPGDTRTAAATDTSTHIYPLTFNNTTNKTTTIVLINDNTNDQVVKLSGANLPARFNQYVTASTDDCKDYGIIDFADRIKLPAKSVTTLYSRE